MDSEVDRADCAGCLDALAGDEDLRETWRLYHLIGDSLRGDAVGALPRSFGKRLAAEPTVLAPRASRGLAMRQRWYALSAAASVAAVALVGWMALPMLEAPVQLASQTPPVASSPGPESPAASPPVAQGVNDYLLAHQRFSPSSAMGGIAPYIRTVAEANGGR